VRYGRRMRVICATDDEYILPLVVAVHSAKDNAINNFDLTVVYFSNELSEKNLSFLASVFKTICISVDFKELIPVENMKKRHHITPTSYSRLLAADQFSGLVMWLDSDTLCLPGWDSIYLDHANIPNDVTLSVVRDTMISGTTLANTRNESMIKMGAGYFNTGVILINCDRWRQLNFADKWPRYLAESDQRGFEYADQCVLNFMCSKEVKYISSRYNTLAATRRKNHQHDPLILHFAGGVKPWTYSIFDPRILIDLLFPRDVYTYLRYQTLLILAVWRKNNALGLGLVREKRRIRRKKFMFNHFRMVVHLLLKYLKRS
jgi:lipopolysaccharide biosynthesis glycosyltransferase